MSSQDPVPPQREESPALEARLGAPPAFVVGIGASAGGLDPLVRFFDNLPKATGMAFVIVQHLSPDFKSLMDELLARHTLLPIHLVEDGMPVEADHVPQAGLFATSPVRVPAAAPTAGLNE